MVLKLSTDMETNGTLQTDSNGYFMMQRKRNSRPSYIYDPKKGLEVESSNYYPVASTASLSDVSGGRGRSLTVLVDRSIGVGSLKDGEIEMMLHRL